MSQHHSKYSIWFFTGALLLTYGILIASAGFREFSHPEAHPVQLAELHIDFWWGLLLIVIGSIYVWAYFPSRQK